MENPISINLFFNITNNLSFNIFLNLIIYSAVPTLGILFARYLMKWWVSRFERRAVEIGEHNTKLHDRLVEIEIVIDSKKESDKYAKDLIRLRYAKARLKKYNPEIANNIDKLLKILPPAKGANSEINIAEAQVTEAKDLIELIGRDIDKLWFKKG